MDRITVPPLLFLFRTLLLTRMLIYVNTVLGTSITINAETVGCIADVKQKIGNKQDIPKDLQNLISLNHEQPLEDDFLVSELFGSKTCVELYLKVDFYIFAMTIDSRTIRYKVSPTQPIINVKRTILSRYGDLSSGFALIYKGRRLEDHLSLWDYNICSGDTIHLRLQIIG